MQTENITLQKKRQKENVLRILELTPEGLNMGWSLSKEKAGKSYYTIFFGNLFNAMFLCHAFFHPEHLIQHSHTQVCAVHRRKKSIFFFFWFVKSSALLLSCVKHNAFILWLHYLVFQELIMILEKANRFQALSWYMNRFIQLLNITVKTLK